MTAEVLAEHRAIWETKPVLRAVYSNYYRKIVSWCREGKSLEVGGGSRTYYLQDDTEIDPWQSKLIVFVGVLMTMFGLVGLFLEKNCPAITEDMNEERRRCNKLVCGYLIYYAAGAYIIFVGLKLWRIEDDTYNCNAYLRHGRSTVKWPT